MNTVALILALALPILDSANHRAAPDARTHEECNERR